MINRDYLRIIYKGPSREVSLRLDIDTFNKTKMEFLPLEDLFLRINKASDFKRDQITLYIGGVFL